MKIALFGATGATGKHLLKQSLERGHSVTALVRNPSAIESQDALTIVKGDATNLDDVRSALRDCEAALVALGATGFGPSDILSTSIKNIVEAMNEQNITRLIVITTSGINPRNDKFSPLLYKWVVKPYLLAKKYEDHVRVEKFLATSASAEKIKWTVVQPPRINEDAITRDIAIKVGELPIGKNMVISYADLACCMLDVVEGNSYSQQIIGVETRNPLSTLTASLMLGLIWNNIIQPNKYKFLVALLAQLFFVYNALRIMSN
jgi:putative NADH-flavin reductase